MAGRGDFVLPEHGNVIQVHADALNVRKRLRLAGATAKLGIDPVGAATNALGIDPVGATTLRCRVGLVPVGATTMQLFERRWDARSEINRVQYHQCDVHVGVHMLENARKITVVRNVAAMCGVHAA